MKSLLVVVMLVTLISCEKEVTTNQTTVRSYDLKKDILISQQKVTYPIDALTYGACTQEGVHITGNIDLTFTVNQIDYILYIHANWIFHLSGVGQISGNKYKLVGHQTSIEKWDTRTSLNEFFNYNRKTILVSEGADDNMTITEVHRLILDENNQIKLQFDKLDLNSCN